MYHNERSTPPGAAVRGGARRFTHPSDVFILCSVQKTLRLCPGSRTKNTERGALAPLSETRFALPQCSQICSHVSGFHDLAINQLVDDVGIVFHRWVVGSHNQGDALGVNYLTEQLEDLATGDAI